MTKIFYVDVVRGKRVVLLAGPFRTHSEALAMVEPARSLCVERYPWTWFDWFGTVSTEGSDGHGVLNVELGVAP